MGGGVRRRVCHSPAEGACRRGPPEGCRCWEPPHALGGLLCGQRGAPEGCAIALPRGCARGGVALGSRRMPWEASYVGGGAPEGCAIALRRGCAGGVCRRDVPECRC